jgi:hypothetical protein
MVKNGKQIPIDPKNPQHKGMASEWMGSYRQAGDTSPSAPKKQQSASIPPGQTTVACPLTNSAKPGLFVRGRQNARDADAKANAEGPKVEGKYSKGFEKKPGQPTDKKNEREIEATLVSRQKTFLQYGSEDNQLTVGQVKGEAGLGVSHDRAKDEYFAGAKVKGEAVLAKYETKGKAARGLIEGEGEVAVGKVAGEAKAGIEWDKGGARAAGAVGVEAIAIVAKGKAQISATPKTLYDNACNLVSPGATYCNAPAWLDHGVVAGVQGEAGVGAAAKAEGAIGKLKEGVWGVKGEAKAGAGLFGGIGAFIGIK